MGVVAMHRDQLTVEVDTVRRLLDEQFPQWSGLAVQEMHTTGTVNAIFRIGTDLAARFPLTVQDPNDARIWLNAEAEAARRLAEVSTVPTSEPGQERQEVIDDVMTRRYEIEDFCEGMDIDEARNDRHESEVWVGRI